MNDCLQFHLYLSLRLLDPWLELLDVLQNLFLSSTWRYKCASSFMKMVYTYIYVYIVSAIQFSRFVHSKTHNNFHHFQILFLVFTFVASLCLNADFISPLLFPLISSFVFRCFSAFALPSTTRVCACVHICTYVRIFGGCIDASSLMFHSFFLNFLFSIPFLL